MQLKYYWTEYMSIEMSLSNIKTDIICNEEKEPILLIRNFPALDTIARL